MNGTAKILAVAGGVLVLSTCVSAECDRGMCKGDFDRNEQVTVNELIVAVNNALEGCVAADRVCIEGSDVADGTIEARHLSDNLIHELEGRLNPEVPNPQRLALQRWYDVNLTANFAIANNPDALAFDGEHIWVASCADDNVTKVRASDGAVLGVYPVGDCPNAVIFDGAYVWVSNIRSDNVTRLRASDGSVTETYSVGSYPVVSAFDGTHIWVANIGDGTVTKLQASDGATLGTYPVGNKPSGIAFDGANVWVANAESATVSKL